MGDEEDDFDVPDEGPRPETDPFLDPDRTVKKARRRKPEWEDAASESPPGVHAKICERALFRTPYAVSSTVDPLRMGLSSRLVSCQAGTLKPGEGWEQPEDGALVRVKVPPRLREGAEARGASWTRSVDLRWFSGTLGRSEKRLRHSWRSEDVFHAVSEASLF